MINIFERKGFYLYIVFILFIFIRLFLEMKDSTVGIVCSILFVIPLFMVVLLKVTNLLKYTLIMLSTIFFIIGIQVSQIQFFEIIGYLYEIIFLYAFLLPNPFLNIIVGSAFTWLIIFNYHGFDDIKSNIIIGMYVNSIISSLLVFSIRYLFQQRKELMKSEKSNQLLLNLFPQPIIIHSDDKVVYINSEGEKLLGVTQKETVLGKTVYDIVHPTHHETALKRIKQAKLMVNTPLSFIEMKIIRLDGMVIDVETASAPIIFKGKEALLTVGKDITEQKQRNDELLRKSDKLSLVGQMAAGIAHEIRNPLTSLKGFLQLIGSEQPNDKREFFDIMLNELERINFIVGEFLILAKPHAVIFKEESIELLCRNVLTLLDTQAILNNVQIFMKVHPNIPFISCEKSQLKQVLINLIKNGIEAMTNGGNITIEIGPTDEQDFVFIRVIDQGCGIEEGKIPELGEPFYTTKEHGTGLGLMVCYKIIENHNGKMHIQSKVGEGTTIEILLPTSND
jgi:PAS domain S-box-containing protein